MRTLALLFGVLVLALGLAACDSTESELDESEVFVGSWTVVEVRDEEGDKTDVFQQGIDEFSTVINADGTYVLTVDYAEERPTLPLSGDYEINEGANDLTLHATIAGNPVQLNFDYDVESESVIHLTINDEIIEAAFGTQPETYEGRVTFTIERQ